MIQQKGDAMAVPFIDLKKQYNTIKKEINTEIDDVLESCNYVLGPKVRQFEEKYAELCGVKHCIAVSNGTAAVHGMIWAADLPLGSGLITPPNTFTATAEGIVLAGHIPVFVDAEPQSWNLCPEKAEEFLKSCSSSGKPIDPKTGTVIRGIVAVDLYGQAADYLPLMRIADNYGLRLFEDAAQSHDASRYGAMTGSFGDAASFSFYPGKNLGAYGEGGAITTNCDQIANRMRCLRDHGSKEKYYYSYIGHNYRMSALQGAVLNVKINYIHRWNNKRIKAAERYNQLLKDLPLRLPNCLADVRHVYHLYAIHTPARNALREYLASFDIGTGLHYPEPLHTQNAYGYLGYKRGDFPVCEENSRENLTLPMFPEITEDQQNEVYEGIKSFYEEL